MCATALMVAWLGAIGMAQMRVTTAEEYTKAMRMTSTAFGAVRTALSVLSNPEMSLKRIDEPDMSGSRVNRPE